MHANKAREIAENSSIVRDEAAERDWRVIKDYIFQKIADTSSSGKSEYCFNLRGGTFREIDSKSEFYIKAELEALGYKVNLRYEKCPNGKREMVVDWKGEK